MAARKAPEEPESGVDKDVDEAAGVPKRKPRMRLSRGTKRLGSLVRTLGPEVALVREDDLLRDIRVPPSLESLRALLKAIGCPALEWDGTRWVDPCVFHLCMKAAFMPGAPDLVVGRKVPPGGSDRSFVPRDEVAANWRFLVSSILSQRHMGSVTTKRSAAALYERVIGRLADMTMSAVEGAVRVSSDARRIDIESGVALVDWKRTRKADGSEFPSLAPKLRTRAERLAQMRAINKKWHARKLADPVKREKMRQRGRDWYAAKKRAMNATPDDPTGKVPADPSP